MEFSLEHVFPIITTTISLFFFASVTEQYLRKRKPHQLMWAIAMFLFAITAGAEGFSLIIGYWIPWVYRAYYVLAAIQVSFMGGGVIYLFDSRNVINERNTWKQFILFGGVWSLFNFLFASRAIYFSILLVPSLLLVILGIVYFIVKQVDKVRANGSKTYYCNFCRTEFDQYTETCDTCTKEKMLKEDVPASSFRQQWHRYITGRFFSHFFIGFSLVFFLMMNLLAWTAPLHEGLLVTGKEVAGLPWQIDPNNPDEARAVVRLFSPLHTVPGAIALTGGGLYSYVTWQLSIRRYKGRFEPSTGFFNVWIAVGAYVLGQGALLSGFGYTLGQIFTFLPTEVAAIGTLYISEVISVSMMYWGFLGSDKLSKEKLLSAIGFGVFGKKPIPN